MASRITTFAETHSHNLPTSQMGSSTKKNFKALFSLIMRRKCSTKTKSGFFVFSLRLSWETLVKLNDYRVFTMTYYTSVPFMTVPECFKSTDVILNLFLCIFVATKRVLALQYGFNVCYSRYFWPGLPEVFPGQTWIKKAEALHESCAYQQP